MPPVIRKTTPDDIDALVVNILAMAWESESRALNRITLHRGVRAVFEQPERGTYWVVENESGEIIGNTLITREWSDWNNTEYWWVQSLYLKPEHRGLGLFQQLQQQLEQAARAENVAEIRLYVERDNERAIAAYRKAGFESDYYRMMTLLLD